jgi:hypothetical protein
MIARRPKKIIDNVESSRKEIGNETVRRNLGARPTLVLLSLGSVRSSKLLGSATCGARADATRARGRKYRKDSQNSGMNS